MKTPRLRSHLIPGAAVVAVLVLSGVCLAAAPAVKVAPTKARAGEAVLVTVGKTAARPDGSALGKPLQFFRTARGWQAVFAIPLKSPPSTLDVVVQGKGVDEKVSVPVGTRDDEEDNVEVNEVYAAPPADKMAMVDADNDAVIKALQNDGPPRFKSTFGKAGRGKVTSVFGTWRMFNDQYRSRHLGVDLAATRGAPVMAVNAGKVTLVRDTFLMGKVVVVEHGAGLASAYFHLDSAKVAEGDEVRRGQRLGGAGDGGRTTGPHIHLGLWAQGGFVDPTAFARLPLQAPRDPGTRQATAASN